MWTTQHKCHDEDLCSLLRPNITSNFQYFDAKRINEKRRLWICEIFILCSFYGRSLFVYHDGTLDHQNTQRIWKRLEIATIFRRKFGGSIPVHSSDLCIGCFEGILTIFDGGIRNRSVIWVLNGE